MSTPSALRRRKLLWETRNPNEKGIERLHEPDFLLAGYLVRKREIPMKRELKGARNGVYWVFAVIVKREIPMKRELKGGSPSPLGGGGSFLL